MCNDTSDLYLISSLVQDSITCKSWFSINDNMFSIFLNRFCWENANLKQEDLKIDNKISKMFHRVHSILTFQNVRDCLTRNLKHNLFRSVLGIVHTKSNNFKVIMSDRSEVFIDTHNSDIRLKDISFPWPTFSLPKHKYAISDFV